MLARSTRSRFLRSAIFSRPVISVVRGARSSSGPESLSTFHRPSPICREGPFSDKRDNQRGLCWHLAEFSICRGPSSAFSSSRGPRQWFSAWGVGDVWCFFSSATPISVYRCGKARCLKGTGARNGANARNCAGGYLGFLLFLFRPCPLTPRTFFFIVRRRRI
jgi:hypothetical protein